MCGIAGILYRDTRTSDDKGIKKMLAAISHRGPDDHGIYINGPIALGHQRLSILDLSPLGHQPMLNQSKTICLTYNGEIFNYIELARELKVLGYTFQSQSDTEVLIAAYEAWGEQCLNKLNGMFAFALWNSQKRELFCARDRFGIKPFYYHITNDSFMFASEIKGLLANIKKRAVNNQVLSQYITTSRLDNTDQTFFQDIFQLLPGHYIKVSQSYFTVKQWWQLTYQGITDESDDDCISHFRELLTDSIAIRLRSDAPIGSLLSGGIDSSSIVATIVSTLLPGNSPFKTFSAVYSDPTIDERAYIKKLHKMYGFNCQFVMPSADDFWNDMERIIYHQDEPFGSTSIYAQWSVLKHAKEVGVKVTLDGQGADEILAGYPIYYPVYLQMLLRQGRLPIFFHEFFSIQEPTFGLHSFLIQSFRRGLSQSKIKPFIYSVTRKDAFQLLSKETQRAFTMQKIHDYHSSTSNEFRAYLAFTLFSEKLPQMLRYLDRNSMAHGIESRPPFLDHRLVEYIFSLPDRFILRDGWTKWILRQSFKDILPDEIVYRRDKLGFPTPEKKWMQELFPLFEKKIIPSVYERQYYNPDQLKKYLHNQHATDAYGDGLLWRIINTELWHQRFIDTEL